MFKMYFLLGFEHIVSVNSLDHILFILALAIIYVFSEYKKVLVLVTAFTIGHSITLALSTLQFINFSTNIIEFLIALTIFISSVYNIYYVRKKDFTIKNAHNVKYLIALVFGLIHGLGFSFTLRALLGAEGSIILPLFGFNIGLEIGQILIVIIILTISTLVIKFVKIKRHIWITLVSLIAAGFSVQMMIDRINF